MTITTHAVPEIRTRLANDVIVVAASPWLRVPAPQLADTVAPHMCGCRQPPGPRRQPPDPVRQSAPTRGSARLRQWSGLGRVGGLARERCVGLAVEFEVAG
ncbi:MAG: hypothetical protein GEU73_09775 [Chloroflexi bacterium]|nr:hypothetical protein [Chloroflexota bacterium]